MKELIGVLNKPFTAITNIDEKLTTIHSFDLTFRTGKFSPRDFFETLEKDGNFFYDTQVHPNNEELLVCRISSGNFPQLEKLRKVIEKNRHS